MPEREREEARIAIMYRERTASPMIATLPLIYVGSRGTVCNAQHKGSFSDCSVSVYLAYVLIRLHTYLRYLDGTWIKALVIRRNFIRSGLPDPRALVDRTGSRSVYPSNEVDELSPRHWIQYHMLQGGVSC